MEIRELILQDFGIDLPIGNGIGTRADPTHILVTNCRDAMRVAELYLSCVHRGRNRWGNSAVYWDSAARDLCYGTEGPLLRIGFRRIELTSSRLITENILHFFRLPGADLPGLEPYVCHIDAPLAFTISHRAPIILSAARNNVPAVYWNSAYAREGGLLSYGVDNADIFRRSASYVDLILRGAKPADLPVQLPTKFEMILNAKTAKALGLEVPWQLQQLADEVIE